MLWITFIYNDFVLETNLTIISSYLLFYACEATKCSGILGIVAYGLMMSYRGKFDISTESHHANHHVWGYVGFVAEALIFLLAGLIMGTEIVEDFKDKVLIPNDVWFAILAFLILIVIRFFCIFLFYPCLSRLGYGFTINEAILVAYGGLRGAVGLALAVVVHNDKDLEKKRGKRVAAVVLLFTSVEALLTLIINAPTTKYVVNALKLAE